MFETRMSEIQTCLKFKLLFTVNVRYPNVFGFWRSENGYGSYFVQKLESEI